MKSACLRPRCTCCGTSETPLWRSGPQGAKSLCNACGVRFKKGKLRYNPESNRFILLDQGVEESCKPLASAYISGSASCFPRVEENDKSYCGGNSRRSGEINSVRKRNKCLKVGRSLQRTKSCHQLETSCRLHSSYIHNTCEQVKEIDVPGEWVESVDDESEVGTSQLFKSCKEEKVEVQSKEACAKTPVVISSQKEKAFSAPASPVSKFYLCERAIINEPQIAEERYSFMMSPKPRHSCAVTGGFSPSVFQYVKLLDGLTLGTHSRKRSLENCDISSIFDRCVSYSAPYLSPQSPSTPETCVRELEALNIRYGFTSEESLDTGTCEEQWIDKESKEQSYSEEYFIAELNAAILKCNGMYHTDLEDEHRTGQNMSPDQGGLHSHVAYKATTQADCNSACRNAAENPRTQLLQQLHQDVDYKSNVQRLYSLMKREFSSMVPPPRGLFSVYCDKAVENAFDKTLDISYRPYLECCLSIMERKRSLLGFSEISMKDILVEDICLLDEPTSAERNQSSKANTSTKTNRLNNKVVKPTPA